MKSVHRIVPSLVIAAMAALFGASCVSATAEDPAAVEEPGYAQLGTGFGGGGGNLVGYCWGIQDGLYCGGDRVSGDPNTLYQCVRGVLYFVQQCGNPGGFGGGRWGGGAGGLGNVSCVWEPPGIPDHCTW